MYGVPQAASLYVEVEVTPRDLAGGISFRGVRQAIELIEQIDSNFQDSQFTMEVIETLFVSLRKDLDFREGKAFLKRLKSLNVEAGE